MYKLNLFERKAYPISSLMPFGMIVGGGLLDVNGRKEKQAAVVINKNGSLMTTWKYRGPDLESSVPEQTAVVTAQLNGILMTLGTGYTLYLDAQRSPSTQYARDVYFPDLVTRAIDAQRRLKFSSGEFFESNYYLTLCWIPPSDQEGRMKEFVMEGHKQKAAELDENMEMFTETAFRLYRTTSWTRTRWRRICTPAYRPRVMRSGRRENRSLRIRIYTTTLCLAATIQSWGKSI